MCVYMVSKRDNTFPNMLQIFWVYKLIWGGDSCSPYMLIDLDTFKKLKDAQIDPEGCSGGKLPIVLF